MKNCSYSIIFILIAIYSCKQKTNTETPISAISIIKGQLHHLDTSLYQIMKVEKKGAVIDTSFIKREEIRDIAAPFLSLPDIAGKDYNNKYTEQRFIDAEQQTLNITSTAINQEEVQQQLIIVNLSDITNGKIKSIYIDRYLPAKDSTIEQKLFWEIDAYFSIGNIITKEGQPEKTTFTKVEWQ